MSNSFRFSLERNSVSTRSAQEPLSMDENTARRSERSPVSLAWSSEEELKVYRFGRLWLSNVEWYK